MVRDFLLPLPFPYVALPQGTPELLGKEQERLLTSFARLGVIGGVLALVAGWTSLQGSVVLPIYILIVAMIGVAAFYRKLAYALRLFLIMSLLYALGLVELINYGLGDEGRIFLYTFIMATATLGRPPAGWIALGLSVGTVLVVGVLLGLGVFLPFELGSQAPSITVGKAVETSVVFGTQTGIFAGVLTLLLQRFAVAWAQEHAANETASREKDHLLRQVRETEQLRLQLEDLNTSLERTIHERTVDFERAAADARIASAAKSAFLAKVSHELRTPLTIIIGYAETLQETLSEPTGPGQRAVQRILTSATHLLHIINDLLDFSGIEAKHLTLRVQTFHLPSILADLNEMAEMLMAYHDNTWYLEGAEAPEQMTTDPGRLRQVLINLVSNAAKFTKQGAITLTVRSVADQVVFEVRDTGAGITPEQLANLFQPFTQADTDMVSKGAGLGLAISRRLTELLGGTLTAVSTVGEGSTFILSLPSDITTHTHFKTSSFHKDLIT